MGADCKSVAYYATGVRIPHPPQSTLKRCFRDVMGFADRHLAKSKEGSVKLSIVAPIAQSVEHLHGKEKVKGSSPFRGSGYFQGLLPGVTGAAG